MRFTPAFLDDIKTRLPVSAVVGQRVKLTKAGREWKGLSPFNAEKTPSFFVNDHKMAWFDFSSGRNGNIFDFVMATEGLSFPETVERLAGEAGLALPEVSEESVAHARRQAGLHDVLELAAAFFEARLQSSEGARARGYLSDRALPAAVQRAFRLGFSPDERFALRDHLAAKGATAETMIEAGLLIHGEGIAVPYDRFRGRIMFPIADARGRTIAFGGRALDPNTPAKYLNSPETSLFHKGAVLYNHHRARKAAHDTGTVIAVEGYVDVIAMAMAGFDNAVAPLGTALTPDQCELLWRMAPEPILCFDGDGAGRKAAYRAIDTALPLIGPAKTLRFAALPDGKDPDEIVRGGGARELSAILDAPKPLVDMLWTRETAKAPLDTPERRAALERRLGEVLREIKDESLRGHYRGDIEGRLNHLFGRNDGQRQRPGAGAGRHAGRRPPFLSRRDFLDKPRLGMVSDPLLVSQGLLQSPAMRRGANLPTREKTILAIVLNHPGLLRRHVEDLAALDLASPDLAALRDALLGLEPETADDHISLKHAVDDAGFEALRAQIEQTVGTAPPSIRPEALESDAAATLAQALALHHRTRALHRELRSVELLVARDDSEIHFEHLRRLQTELTAIEGTEAALDGFGGGSGYSGRDL